MKTREPMPNYRRARLQGGTYFITVVTFRRQRFLCDDDVRKALRDGINKTQGKYPFGIDAWALLPDHLHCIWTLREGDSEFSYKWSLIKSGVTRRLLADDAFIPEASVSRNRRREGPVWQRRFWEHRIRDEDDLYAHLDYIHYNPVKHGLENTVRKWRFSSFHSFVERGLYSPDWGLGEEQDIDAGE